MPFLREAATAGARFIATPENTMRLDRDRDRVLRRGGVEVHLTATEWDLLRTCDGLGVEKVILSGYTPYPKLKDDPRLPHLSEKIHAQISKTALGAENSVRIERQAEIKNVLDQLSSEGYVLAALEQSDSAISLPAYRTPEKIALLLGSEVTGIDKALLEQIETHLEIPMYGKKESFNVVEATSMALYHFRFY